MRYSVDNSFKRWHRGINCAASSIYSGGDTTDYCTGNGNDAADCINAVFVTKIYR